MPTLRFHHRFEDSTDEGTLISAGESIDSVGLVKSEYRSALYLPWVKCSSLLPLEIYCIMGT